jgi:hypothetical protein
MADVYKTETRTINGVDYRVDWTHDHDHGSPATEYDGHGCVFETNDTPAESIELLHELDDEPNMEDVVRYQMMRELVRPSYRANGLYYDVWETLKIARRDRWSIPNPMGLTPEERAMEAIDADYRYLKGWYDDDWHWCGITVIKEGEDGVTYAEESLWGIESSDDEYHDEVINDLVAQIEYHAKASGEALTA